MDKKEPYQRFRIDVPADFQDVFTHFYFAENKSGETVTKTLLPSYQTILLFNFGARALLHSRQNTQITVGRCLVLGPIKQAFDYSLPVDAAILVANFKDDAFYRFFGHALVAEQTPVHPDELLAENCFTLLWHQLQGMKDVQEQVNHIFAFCRPYLGSRDTIAEQLARFNDDLLDPIKTIAGVQQQSERNIQIHHKKYLGYSAKERNRYRRFLKAIESVQQMASHTGKMDWFAVISECGYYDQSQLIHDFKHYINLSPVQYLKFQQDICNAKP